jgi:chemotaxis regulatin CheY-phosphate phosphatase CheZ
MVFKDIKKISSDAVGLITEFGSPEMTESLDIIKEITVAAQGIMESLENPQLVKNIENMRLSMKSMRDARDRMKNVFEQLAETGILDEVKNTTRTIRSEFY